MSQESVNPPTPPDYESHTQNSLANEVSNEAIEMKITPSGVDEDFKTFEAEKTKRT